jgi:hypothetical protein
MYLTRHLRIKSTCSQLEHAYPTLRTYRSDLKAQKFRQEFHFAKAAGICSSSCRTRSNRIRGEHISRRLKVSDTCSCRRAIFSFNLRPSGRPSALQCVVSCNRSVSLNEANARFWFAFRGSLNASWKTYDIAPLERRTKSTALSLKFLVRKFMSWGSQFASPPRSLLLLFATRCWASVSFHPSRSCTQSIIHPTTVD